MILSHFILLNEHNLQIKFYQSRGPSYSVIITLELSNWTVSYVFSMKSAGNLRKIVLENKN